MLKRRFYIKFLRDISENPLEECGSPSYLERNKEVTIFYSYLGVCISWSPALAPNLCLPDLAPNLYLLALAPICIYQPWLPICIYRYWPIVLLLSRGLSLHVPTLSPQFVFVFTALAYDLYYQSGAWICIYLIICSSSSGSSNSSSSNFFGTNNTSICMPILVI